MRTNIFDILEGETNLEYEIETIHVHIEEAHCKIHINLVKYNLLAV